MTGSGTWSAGGCGCRRVALINFRVSLRRSCGHRFRIAGRAHFTERSCRRPDPPSGSWAWGWALSGRRAGCARFRFRFPGEIFLGYFGRPALPFYPPHRPDRGRSGASVPQSRHKLPQTLARFCTIPELLSREHRARFTGSTHPANQVNLANIAAGLCAQRVPGQALPHSQQPCITLHDSVAIPVYPRLFQATADYPRPPRSMIGVGARNANLLQH